MEPIFFLKGLVIGFAMAVPIGPIGILCIRKTLSEGHGPGLVIGLGGATADSLYSAVAAFGLTVVSDVAVSQEVWLRLAGGGILLFLGVKTLYGRRTAAAIPPDKSGLVGSYLSTFLLGLTNPLTIFAFLVVFAAFGLKERLGIASASFLVLGVFTGSCLWFLTIGYVAALFRKKLNSDGLRWVNRISGSLIIVSGIAAFVSVM